MSISLMTGLYSDKCWLVCVLNHKDRKTRTVVLSFSFAMPYAELVLALLVWDTEVAMPWQSSTAR